MKYHVEYDIEFKKNPYKGLYIAIEGIDGSGKTTQVEALKKYFESQGAKVVLTSEPRSESVVGKIIRDILRSNIQVPPESLQYLYSADRAINHMTIVEPALISGKTVLSHRSFWSVIPYGVMDKGLDEYNEKEGQILAVAHGLLSMYHQFISPDLTFYLDVSVDTAMDRLSKMKKVKEIYEKKEKLSRIIQGYKWQLREFQGEFVAIDGERSEEEVSNEMIHKIESFRGKTG